MNAFIQSFAFLVIAQLAATAWVSSAPTCCPDSGIKNEEAWVAGTNFLNVAQNDGYVFSAHHFAEIVALHDELRPKLTSARRLLTTHAAELARLVKALPGAGFWSESFIRDQIRYWKKALRSVSGASVFQPWTNRWQGMWSNGSSQFHIWDETRHWGEQWIQVVAQSEHAFPEESRLTQLLAQRKSDLGINVYSAEYGISGWVSKRQHVAREIPCLGYLIDQTTLLWACAMDFAGQLETHQWFVYLERVDRTAASTQYIIAGHPFTIENGIVWNQNSSSVHAGRYTAKQDL